MHLLQNILVPMSDGVTIALDVYLPDANGRYPAVFYSVPYRKDDFYPRILNGAGLPQIYTTRNFAFVLGDVRGTNNSEGVSNVMWSEREQQDGYEVVEWIAQQPWCTGKVGMTGTSYGFWTSLLTAAKQPPHLRTIVPLYGSTSSYYAFCEGGLPMAFGYHADYLGIMLAFQGSPPGYRDKAGNWRRIWEQRLANYTPWGLEWFDHPADDEYWFGSSVSRLYDRIQIPVFVIGGWWDRYSGEPLRIYKNLRGPVKVLIGPWQHLRPDMGIPGPRADYDAILRWFDYWLKDEQNGIMQEPPITLYTQHYGFPAEYRDNIPGAWRCEKSWPITGTESVQLFLEESKLCSQVPTTSGSRSYSYDPTSGVCSRLTGGIYGGIGMPVDQRPDETKSLVFTSAPLERKLNATGFCKATLFFASTASRMAIVVKLCDVAPDGTVALVTRGQLSLAHREGLDRPKVADPGTIYELHIELKATSYVFEPGHSIRLAITSGEFQTFLPTPESGINTIYWGRKWASYIEIPSVPLEQAEALPSKLTTLPSPPPEPPSGSSFSIGPDRTGTWEAVRNFYSEFEGPEGSIEFSQRTASRIHPERPSEAVVGSEAIFIFKYESGEIIESRGRTEIKGGTDSIHTSASLAVTEQGVKKFEKNWSRSHPRQFV